jgi:hypothetical protein
LPEIREVDSELAGIALAANVVKNVLDDAQVHALHHWKPDAAPLGVLTTMLTQVLVLLNVGLEGGCLFVSRERATS